MGHDFDFGGWYIWSGPCAEFQANIKLNYVLETLLTETSPWRIRSWVADKDGNKLPMTGRQWVDTYYGPAGSAYLKDGKRDWNSMESDDIHGLFLAVVRRHGWEPMKKWYRAYARLEARKLQRPEATADKVVLACAILSQTSGEDLVPLFASWKLPVTRDAVAAMMAKYPIAEVTRP